MALSDFSRTPVSLVVLTLDFCGRTFGVSPCLASGEPCYNTWPTCKYTSAYLRQTKAYEFTSADTPLPFKEGERPYLDALRYMPTEIKDNLTTSARVKAVFHDEPDADAGVDPYVAQRASVQGTFWKKLLARNGNYRGREARVYEGCLGDARGQFTQTFVGKIDNVKLNRGSAEVEIVDLLKSLSSVEVPPKLDIKLVAAVDASQTEFTLSTVDGLDSPSGYVRLGDEIVYYTGVNAPANQLTGCSRGYFGTEAAAHAAKDKVQKVRYFAPANPFDILKEMLAVDAGMDAAYVDTAAFDYWRDWPGGEVDFSAIVSEPTKLSEIYFEVVDLVDCKSWVGEDLKVTLRRNLPNEPGRSYAEFTDEANIVHESASVDLNQDSRISRVLLYWDKSAIGKLDDPASYGRIDVALDEAAESANDYGTEAEKKFFCRWLRSGYMQEETLDQFVKNFTMRQVWRQRDPSPLLAFDVELKDSAVKTGDYVLISTDELLEKDGLPVEKAVFQVAARESRGGRVTLKCLRASRRRVDIIAPDTAPDYADATGADLEYGYVTGDDGLMPDGRPGWHIWG